MPKCIQSDLKEEKNEYIVLVCMEARANGKSLHTKRYLNKLGRDMRGCCLLKIINHSESSRFRYITSRIHIFPFYLSWDYNILFSCAPFQGKFIFI
jgi:hypothetical protein